MNQFPSLPDDMQPVTRSQDVERRAMADGKAASRATSAARPSPDSRRVIPLPPPPRADERHLAPHLSADSAPPIQSRRFAALHDREWMLSFLTSFVVHFSLLIALAWLHDATRPPRRGLELTSELLEPAARSIEVGDLSWKIDPVHPSPTQSGASSAGAALPTPQELVLAEPTVEKQQPTRAVLSAAEVEDLMAVLAVPSGGGLGGRDSHQRGRLVRQRGGSDASETAVERGLRWLMVHQQRDGGWRFHLRNEQGEQCCANPGTVASTTGATALALLPFLGAGHTPLQGEYQETVRRGLYYLGSRARITPAGADLQEGTMYAQGLSAIALCEAYAMTGDAALKELAQRALDFIVYAQDAKGGGWRYVPGQPGDTTVTGWQLMALKSGHLAGLQVPSPHIFLVDRFLDSVQSDEGALYGYLEPSDPRPATTAVGLLCRMYRGWSRNHPALTRGIRHLVDWGPSETDLYFDYYATQVLCHVGGPDWETWNRRLRDHLIATQATTSHEAGSWHFDDNNSGQKAGRLYSTAMAVMILEVYYRYLPLYDAPAVESSF